MSNFELPKVMGFDLHQSPLRDLMMQDPMKIRPEGVGPLRDGGTAPVGPSSPGGFESFLADSVGKVAELQADVQAKTRGLALGEDVEVHDVMLAASKSEVAFNLLLEVRNKLVDAWEKLSRSSV
ncbi:MAG: flagellar hook-basal body complex protein FliE [Planctomycetes bacterium]|nr:flagellar hook-basal body complex protein FliE [Planctomycetota bacterium]MCB9884057.1 flagellar hook-basal body complex protein FliE [Planctomycetota bacterium]